jgi:arsenite oxidase small subunit
MKRRDFLLGGAAVGAVAAAGVVVPLALVFADDDDIAGGIDGVAIEYFERQRVGSLAGLSSGEPQYFDYPLVDQSNIMVDLGDRAIGGIGENRSVVAFSNICTHMGCPVTDYQPEHKVLGPCVCHYTTFDLSKDGRVVLGQATQNLPRLLLESEGDDVFATGVFRLIYGYANNLAGVNVEIASTAQ